MDLSNKLSTLQHIGILFIVIPVVINTIKGLREDLSGEEVLKDIKTILTSIFLLIIILFG